MKPLHFDRHAPSIFVTALLWGPLGQRTLDLVLDTGASRTLIKPELLDGLGYSPRDAERVTTISSPLGREPGYLIRVARFECLDVATDGALIHAHDLGDDDDVDGLLGLDFLRQFRLVLDFGQGTLEAQRHCRP